MDEISGTKDAARVRAQLKRINRALASMPAGSVEAKGLRGVGRDLLGMLQRWDPCGVTLLLDDGELPCA